jgi:hypothetical protein
MASHGALCATVVAVLLASLFLSPGKHCSGSSWQHRRYAAGQTGKFRQLACCCTAVPQLLVMGLFTSY